MCRELETAGFRPDDEECLVAASLACLRCLSGRVHWRLRPGGYDPRVECRCRACGHRRTVFLTPEQALRLSLHPPCQLDPDARPRAPILR